MVPLLLAARELGRALHAVWRDPETKALPFVAGALVLTGTLFYWRFEDWTIIESLYFCIVTLTTVGYGDFAPTTPGTQIFTIVYILTGFGVLVALLTSVAEKYIEQKREGGSRGRSASGDGARRLRGPNRLSGTLWCSGFRLPVGGRPFRDIRRRPELESTHAPTSTRRRRSCCMSGGRQRRS